LLGIGAEDLADIHQAAQGLFYRCMHSGAASPPRFAAREPRSKLRADIFASPTGDAFRKPPPMGLRLPSRGTISQVLIQGLPWWGTWRRLARAGVGLGSLQMERMMSPKASATDVLASPACVFKWGACAFPHGRHGGTLSF
jgi:hypothetical protein